MKLASIMPVAGVDLIASNYHFCFAELANRWTDYAAYYRNAPGIVIMDTMVFERKGPITLRSWLNAIDAVHPTVAITPDVLGNAEATKANYRFYKQFTETPLMAVAQGRDFTAFVECFEYFIERNDWVALPVQIPSRRKERFALLEVLGKSGLPSNNKIHLLGASSDTLALEQTVRNLPFVLGLDTTKPIAAALNHFEMPCDAPNASDRAHDFFETSRSMCLTEREKMQQNTDYMRSLICSV